MQKVIAILFFGGLVGVVVGQQLPHFSQYVQNDFLLNPAIAGSKKYNPVRLSFRSQWAGFKDAPMTQVASIHGEIIKGMGLGSVLFNDVTGPVSRAGVQLAYAYHFKVGDFNKISIGMAGLLYQHVLDKGALTLDEPDDMAIQGGKERRFTADAIFGVAYTSETLYGGFSAPQLFQSRLDFSEEDDGSVSNLMRHYFLTLGYTFRLGADYFLDPSVLFKAAEKGSPPQLDVNLRFLYKDLLWAGLSYRHTESVVVMAGIQKNNFLVGYSYDITLSNISKHSTGSHEIMLGLNFPKIKKGSKASY